MHTYKGYSVVPSMWLPGTSGLPGTILSSGSSCGGDGFGRPLDQSCSIPSATARHTSVCSVVHSRCGYLSCVKHFLDVPVTVLSFIA